MLINVNIYNCYKVYKYFTKYLFKHDSKIIVFRDVPNYTRRYGAGYYHSQYHLKMLNSNNTIGYYIELDWNMSLYFDVCTVQHQDYHSFSVSALKLFKKKIRTFNISRSSIQNVIGKASLEWKSKQLFDSKYELCFRYEFSNDIMSLMGFVWGRDRERERERENSTCYLLSYSFWNIKNFKFSIIYLSISNLI